MLTRLIALLLISTLVWGQQDTTSKIDPDSVKKARASEKRRLQKLKELSKESQFYINLDSLKEARLQREKMVQFQSDSIGFKSGGYPVVLYQDTLFYIYSKVGPFQLKNRANSIANKIRKLVDDETYDPAKLIVVRAENNYDIWHEHVFIYSVTARDAYAAKSDQRTLAQSHVDSINEAIDKHLERQDWLALLIRGLLLIAIVTGYYYGMKYLNKVLDRLKLKALDAIRKYIRGVEYNGYVFLTVEKEVKIVQWLLNMIQKLSNVFVIYLSLPIVFSVFPSTRHIAEKLFGYALSPIIAFGGELIGYIPELITIAVIILITRYALRFLKFIASEIESEKLVINGFYPDWAEPTYKILRIVTYILSFMIIFPYLPGSDSPVFKGVSVFIGVLVSFGSSSAVGNIIAGLVITYMRAFNVGDRVKIDDTVGDIIEKTMLVTRIRTIKNEDITIPNSKVMTAHTVNYSANAKAEGLILHQTVTIGYDVPWRTVHELLINAAKSTVHCNANPEPYVLQSSLDDFYVSYQINFFTSEPNLRDKIYSNLNENIQDQFNEAGVEILSPHYRFQRDGSETTIPASYRSPDYKAPAFNVHVKTVEN